jgi:TonB-dependent starch-binding outer membrane protein SusC
MKVSLKENLQKICRQQSQHLCKLLSFALGILFVISFSLPAKAQNTIRVKGRITNESGQPIQRASITVKGSGGGVTANDNGDFEIDAPSNGTLVVSAVNFTATEVRVGGKQTVNVSLASLEKTESEVIVVGYGTQRKKDITGSVVSVSEKVFDEVPAANLTMALQGRAAGVDIARTGVRPGSSGQIRIRGNRSLTAGNEPLLVVDGFPYFGSINDLNVDDIASIDILKDASATAIFGSRGSNGVIIITTKRGRPGKPVISYNTSLGWSQIIDEFPVFNASEFYDFKAESRYGGSNGGPTIFTQAELDGKAAGTNTNWQGLLYKKGFVQTHDLGLSGGTDLTQYGIGISYLNQDGIIPLVGFERFAIRATIDQKIGKRVKIGLNTMNTLSYTEGDGVNPMYNTLALSPLLSPYNPDGSVNVQPLVGHQDVGFRLNPLTLTNKDAVYDKRRRLRTYNTLYGEVQIIQGLKYRINVQLDIRQDNYGTYRGANTVLTGSSSTPFLSNTASTENGEAWNYDIFHQLTYEKTIAEKHRINFTTVYEVQETESKNSNFSGTGIPADYVQNTNPAQFASVITGSGSYARSGLISYMARLNYTFNDKYNLTATFRRDGSSVLSPGNKYFNYPALAASWNISDETFLQNTSWLSNLKLRVGWGKTAQQGLAAYSTLGNLQTNNYNFGNTTTTGYFVSVLPNPALKWEETTVANVGLDFGFLNNRITGSVDIYDADTKDILVAKSLPISNGANSIFTNAASTSSKGIEVMLSTVNIETRSGFKWTTDINWSLNREKITALEEPGKMQDIGNGWFVGQPLTVIYDFKKIGIWQTKDAAEIALYGAPQAVGRIRVEDRNNDKKITADDMQVIGSAQPDWIAGMTHRFSYKSFDLSVVAFARWGGTAIATYLQSNNGGAGGYAFFSQARVNQWKVDYWTPTNPTNAFPHPEGQILNDNYASTLGYFDATFVRVRSINLGYAIPAKILSKAGISSARVFASVTNPFIVYAPIVRDGYAIDPEGTGTGNTGNPAVLTPQGGSAAAAPNRSITIGLNTPPTREFIFGLNLKF